MECKRNKRNLTRHVPGACESRYPSESSPAAHLTSPASDPRGRAQSPSEGGRVPPRVRGARSGCWTDAETQTLRELCLPYAKLVNWSSVVEQYGQIHRKRTKAALQARWQYIKKMAQAESQSAGRSHGESPEGLDDPSGADGAGAAAIAEVVGSASVPDVREPDSLPASESDAEVGSQYETIEIDGCDDTVISFGETFRSYLEWAELTFQRQPVRRPSGCLPKELLLLADYYVSMESMAVDGNQCPIGKLNACVYAAARTVVQFQSELVRRGNRKVAEWFSEKKKVEMEFDRKIKSIEMELERRKARRDPVGEVGANFWKLKASYGRRSTRDLRQILETLVLERRLVRARIDVREQEIRRKRLRKRFAARPSLDVLRERDDREVSGRETPSGTSVYSYWERIIGTKVNSSPESVPALCKWRERMQSEYRGSHPVESAELTHYFDSVVKRCKPWKAPGPDGLQAFWWKKLPTARRRLRELVVNILETGRVPGNWFCRGRTVLLYKTGESKLPQNYRPITCLNTCYKILTGVVNRVLLRHLQQGTVISESQRALRTGDWGCTHAHILDRAMVLDAMSQKRHALSMAWVDFQKAYDSVPHDFLQWVLKAVNCPPQIQVVLTRLMSRWRTSFQVQRRRGIFQGKSMRIRRGVFQGDSMSPTLFILAMSPLSFALNEEVEPMKSSSGWFAGYGFQMGHQFYMDDLKLYAKSKAQLSEQVNLVRQIASAIGLSVNTSKCAEVHYDPVEVRGHVGVEGHEEIRTTLPTLGALEVYKYLGIEQRLLASSDAVSRFELAFLERCRTIFQSQLTWGGIVLAYNTIALPVMKYVYMQTFGGQQKLVASEHRAAVLDGRVRDLLRQCKCLFRSNCVARLYLPRELGGWGLQSVEDCLKENILAVWAYVTTHERMRSVHFLFQQLSERGKRNPILDGYRILKECNIGVEVYLDERKVRVGDRDFSAPTPLSQYLRVVFRAAVNEKRKASWEELPAAGSFVRCEGGIDPTLSSLWMRAANVGTIAMRNVIGAQEGCLLTRMVSEREGGSRLCRMCRREEESVVHITSRCGHWLANLYVERHDSVARNLYFLFCRLFGFPPVHYSNRVPCTQENVEYKLIWDLELPTRVPIHHRRPDMVVFDHRRREITVVEVSVAHAAGLDRQRNLKINRYTVNSNITEDEMRPRYPPGANLVADLSGQFGMRVTFLPVVVGTCGEHLGVTKVDLMEKLKLGSTEVDRLMERLSRSAVLGTSRVIRAHMAAN